MLIEKDLFDEWASKYENDIHTLQNVYPFAGYFDVVEQIKNQIKTADLNSILDLGVGTGLMLSKIIENGNYSCFGCDFSPKMVNYAQKKLKIDHLFVHDIRENNLPEQVHSQEFDLIYSAYTFHHFETDMKIAIINNYMNLLSAKGKFIIADISFDDEEQFKQVKDQEGDRWDGDEEDGYFRKNNFKDALEKAGFNMNYTKISYCAGIYEIEKC